MSEERLAVLEAQVASLVRHNERHCALCEREAAEARMRPHLELERALAEQDHARRRAYAEANPWVRVDVAPDVFDAMGRPIGRVDVPVGVRRSFVIDKRHGPFFHEDAKASWDELVTANAEIADLMSRGVLVVTNIPTDEIARRRVSVE